MNRLLNSVLISIIRKGGEKIHGLHYFYSKKINAIFCAIRVSIIDRILFLQ